MGEFMLPASKTRAILARCGVGIALVFCLVLTGCSKAPPTGEVSGMVKFKGEPIPEGQIHFMAEDGRAASADIKDGEYHLANAPVGPCGLEILVKQPVGFSNLPPQVRKGAVGMMKMAKEQGMAPPEVMPKEASTRRIRLPERYSSAQTSGLKYTVVSGEQTHNLDLKP
jgi:hypothetical protein